ncbi:hypothetical protein BU26DRAFT_266900 [Trematosphaeria pertusa]|uniref:Uncharacterized protein n=1 Tax=Trematosphaeria pertusa TaxID=390896 RepID=A0A6A6IJR5_9PLEO|nr:uncharacterized protein BU26DRAFT_266900 [Trematosphaeria pertusa]KAF2250616.1 hypothetical protein BU26DRAFT_266900 [Trematosphaeria pertusa]
MRFLFTHTYGRGIWDCGPLDRPPYHSEARSHSPHTDQLFEPPLLLSFCVLSLCLIQALLSSLATPARSLSTLQVCLVALLLLEPQS